MTGVILVVELYRFSWGHCHRQLARHLLLFLGACPRIEAVAKITERL